MVCTVCIVVLFLIDYRCETLVYWTTVYCIFYAINGFQNYIDLSRMDNNALNIFMLFLGITISILLILNPNAGGIMRGIWLFAWTSTLYIPITALIKRVCDDR